MTAYVVAEIEVADPETADRYRVLARKAVDEFGGTYVVRPQEPQMLEGEWVPGRTLVVLGFDNVEVLHAWYASDTYAEALEFSRQSMIRRLAVVDGDAVLGAPAPSAT
jgi:uncharacterized protein (DUF1330 family)